MLARVPFIKYKNCIADTGTRCINAAVINWKGRAGTREMEFAPTCKGWGWEKFISCCSARNEGAATAADAGAITRGQHN